MKDFREPLLHKERRDGATVVFVIVSVGALVFLCITVAIIAWPK